MTGSRFSAPATWRSVRRCAPWVWVVALALHVVLTLLIVFVVFPAGMLRWFPRHTGGLISAVLAANALLLLGVVGAILRGFGRLRAPDLGLQRSRLPSAVLITAGTWLAVQAAVLVLARSGGHPITWHPGWSAAPGRLIGQFIAQLLGNALYEEILFRGFLLRQLWLWFERRGSAHALLYALLISQAAFALIHVPIRLSEGVSMAALPLELARLAAIGVLLGLAYVRSDNLPALVGIHAMNNAPTLLTLSPVDLPATDAVAIVASLALILAPRRREDRRFA